MDKAQAVQTEIPFKKPVKKKCVEYLYIEADEDRIHKQEKTVLERVCISAETVEYGLRQEYQTLIKGAW